MDSSGIELLATIKQNKKDSKSGLDNQTSSFLKICQRFTKQETVKVT